jgi:hypothetical protein
MKTLALAVVLAVSAVSSAAINLNIDTQYMTVIRPSSGSVFVTFTGTIDVLLPTFDVSSATLEFAGNGTDFLPGAFDAGFLAYLGAAAPGVDYAGALFTAEVSSTDDLGLYWLNGSGSGMTPLSEFIVSATNGTETATDNEIYGVDVVPEPASLAVLGLGLVAIARRRRKA